MKFFVWFVFAVSLVACGPKGDDLSQQNQNACPSAVYPLQHEVTLNFSTAVPPKLALVLEGQNEYNDCASVPVQAPNVRLTRSGGVVNFVVPHAGAYASPPQDISFKLVGSDACGAAAKDLFVISKFPLRYVTDYPNGKKCGSRTQAQATFIVQ